MFRRYFGINVFKRHNSESKVTIVCVRHNFPGNPYFTKISSFYATSCYYVFVSEFAFFGNKM